MSTQFKHYQFIYNIYDHEFYTNDLRPLEQFDLMRADFYQFNFQISYGIDYDVNVSGYIPDKYVFPLTGYTTGILRFVSKENYIDGGAADLAVTGFYSADSDRHNLAKGRFSITGTFSAGIDIGQKLMLCTLVYNNGNLFSLGNEPIPGYLHKEV